MVDMAREVPAAIEEALSRYGIAGRVSLEGTQVLLMGHGSTVSLDGSELSDWAALDAPGKRRLVERLARELAQQRRPASVAPPSRSFSGTGVAGPLVGSVVLAVAALAAWRYGFSGSAPVAPVGDRKAMLQPQPTVVEPTREVRAADSCAKVRARIATGGSVTPLDTDGWIVQISLIGRGPGLGPDNPKLTPFFDQPSPGTTARHVRWPDAPELAKVDNPETFVTLGPEPLASMPSFFGTGLRVTLSGGYVSAYFDESRRLSVQRLAAALYEATDARYGALYARCATGTTNHIGAWFRGPDLRGAATLLVGTMGLAADIPHLAKVGAGDDAIVQGRALDAFSAQAGRLDRTRVAVLVGEHGGMVADRAGRWATLTFPFPDANRASRTSLTLARASGVGRPAL